MFQGRRVSASLKKGRVGAASVVAKEGALIYPLQGFKSKTTPPIQTTNSPPKQWGDPIKHPKHMTERQPKGMVSTQRGEQKGKICGKGIRPVSPISPYILVRPQSWGSETGGNEKVLKHKSKNLWDQTPCSFWFLVKPTPTEPEKTNAHSTQTH